MLMCSHTQLPPPSSWYVNVGGNFFTGIDVTSEVRGVVSGQKGQVHNTHTYTHTHTHTHTHKTYNRSLSEGEKKEPNVLA